MALNSSKYLNSTLYSIALVYDTALVKNYETKPVAFTLQVS
jgi:hypothetical protein